ncbi:MAG: PAS domain S-box protein [Desulfobacterales bacterium]|nr:MAG: PAS domain S-box protein [Desulfobacterales bacterium]
MKKPNRGEFAKLRRRALKRLRELPPDGVGASNFSEQEAARLIHDLQVNQIELEMQTAELCRSQRKLEESRQKYSDLFDLAPTGYFTLGQNALILDANLTGANMLRTPRNALKGLPLTDFIAAECQDAFYAHCRQSLETKERQTCEIKMKKKDGTPFYAQLESIAVEDSERNFSQLRTVISDITERKQTEEKLRNSEKRYRNLFDGIPMGLYRTNPEGRIMNINPAMVELLGYPDRDTLLQTATIETYMRATDRQRLQILLEEQGFVRNFTVELRRYDDTPIWVTIHAKIVRDADAGGTYYEGAMEDITARKKAEEQIRALTHQLLTAQESERQMISRELHDRVAQDLSILKMGLEALSNHQTANAPAISRDIAELAKILQGTIGAVRDLSYDLRPPGLEEMGLVETVSLYCEEFAENHGLKVGFKAPGMINLKLDFDTAINLYRLIQEGLINVRKHARASQVSVRLIAASPNIILRIEDDGQGFDVERRLETLTKEKRMGLRSMEERAKLLGGQMTIQSRPMKGTKIHVTFPQPAKHNGSKENHIDR